jgi:hypothetical protein
MAVFLSLCAAFRNQFGIKEEVKAMACSFAIPRIVAAALAASLIGATAAQADILQISATGLVRHQDEEPSQATVVEGVLRPDVNQGLYYVPVVFPRDGERVCRFSLVYRDVNNNEAMTVRLLRKVFKVGQDAFTPPIVMATLTTAPGVVDAVRRETTTAVASRLIKTTNSFYFIEVQVPSFNIDILGFQIEVLPACS